MGEQEPQLPIRELVDPQTFLLPTPTAVVLLKQDHRPRNMAFCSGFLGLPTAGSREMVTPFASTGIRTRWLIKNGELSTDQLNDCPKLVDQYDYARAGQMITALSEDAGLAASLVGPGPFIAEFFPDGSALVVSGSRRSQTSLTEFAFTWTTVAAGQAQRTQRPPPTLDQSGRCNFERSMAQLGCEIAAATIPGSDVVIGVAVSVRNALCRNSDVIFCRWTAQTE